MVWEWYAWRRERVESVQPNAGHRALVALERACAARGSAWTLVTQNVDGLHQAAGSVNVIELHGNIRRAKCFDHHHPARHWPADAAPPRCERCGAWLRPDVVWFGEALPAAALEQAIGAARAAGVFLCVGTSTVVEPAASLPFLAREAGARVIEINPEPTPLTPHAWLSLRGASGALLPQMVEP